MSVEEDVKQISDALVWKCERCGSADVDVRRETPIPKVPFAIYSYRCRPCGLDSTKKTVTVILTLAEMDIMALGLQQIAKQYPKVAPLIDHLDSLHEEQDWVHQWKESTCVACGLLRRTEPNGFMSYFVNDRWLHFDPLFSCSQVMGEIAP